MKLVKPTFTILDELNGDLILKKIERIARECYQSVDIISTNSSESAIRLIRDILIKNGHWAMIEHGISFSVLFQNCDRGFAHELVRHRLASFAQESTDLVDMLKNINKQNYDESKKNKMNLIFSDGSYLFCYSDLFGKNHLRYIYRKPPYEKIYDDSDLCLMFDEKKGRNIKGYVIATSNETNVQCGENLTAESGWKDFKPGQLMVFSKGKIIFTG